MAGWRLTIAGAALGLIGAGPAMVSPPRMTDLRAIDLKGGVNRVPGFLIGGRTATIVKAWRDNGNSHGYFVWMVLAGRAANQAPLVEFEGGIGHSSPGDTISASPFDGERVTSDVRFATARIDGKPVSLAIRGDLDESPSGIIADHATATIQWLKLVHRENEIGGAPDAFMPIGSVRTTKRYCNVDLALRDRAGIALPRDFAGANTIDGCFADN